MKKHSLVVVVVIIVGAIVCWAGGKYERKSLVGIEGIWVYVEDLNPDAKAAGLRKDLFQTDIELKLRLAGIKVLSKEEYLTTSGRPYLFLSIHVLTSNDNPPFYAVATGLNLRQGVFLTRDLKIESVDAITWLEAGVLLLSRRYLESDIRKQIKQMTDIFINDYLAANPKEREKKKPTFEELVQPKTNK